VNLFRTLAMVGLVGVGMVYGEDNQSTDDTQKDSNTTLDNYFSDQRTKIKKTSGTSGFKNIQNADVVFLAKFNPKRTPTITVTEYLKGKGSSELGLALLQAQSQIMLYKPSHIIVYANYKKYDIPLETKTLLVPPLKGNQFGIYEVKNGTVSFDGQEITIQELKKRIKSVDSTTPSPSKTP
jgi:archaellum component FlaF (FlaF/FlaG flagellin family)